MPQLMVKQALNLVLIRALCRMNKEAMNLDDDIGHAAPLTNRKSPSFQWEQTVSAAAQDP